MKLPAYAWTELNEHINFVLDVFAEPPYSILVCEKLLCTTLDKLPSGTNVFIINVPYFADCPSKLKDRSSFIKLFQDEFPYLDFCMIDNQYLVADTQVSYEEALTVFTTK